MGCTGGNDVGFHSALQVVLEVGCASKSMTIWVAPTVVEWGRQGGEIKSNLKSVNWLIMID